MDGEPTFDDRLAVCKAAHSGMANLKMLDALAGRYGDTHLINEAPDRDVPGFFAYLAAFQRELDAVDDLFDSLEAVFSRAAPSVAFVSGEPYSSYHRGAIFFARVALSIAWEVCGCRDNLDPEKMRAHWPKVRNAIIKCLRSFVENELSTVLAGLDIEAARVLPELNEHFIWRVASGMP